ncbi:MAG: AMP-binding protein [Thermodesulfobacteriota bacterium]
MVYLQRPWLKSYDHGVRTDVEITDQSLPARWAEIRRDCGGQPALHFLGVTLTFDQLMALADRFAQALIRNGLVKGDLVAINLPNIPQFPIALIGAMKAGCAISGLSPLNTADEMVYQLNDSNAKALVTLDAIFEHRFAKVADRVPGLKLVAPAGLVDFLPKVKQILAKWLKKIPSGRIMPLPDKEVIAFKDILTRYPAQTPEVKITQEDVCLIQYTGGTTGPPKGAVLTHKNVLANVTQFNEWTKLERGREVMLSGFPMFHLAGMGVAMISMSMGVAQVLIPDPRNTKHIIKEFAKYKPNMMTNVPSLYLMLLAEPEFKNLEFSQLRFCVSGAAPFPVDGINALEAVVGKGKLMEVYGMTETSPLQTCNPYQNPKRIGSVGLPFPSTYIRIMNLDAPDQDVPLGQEGEIVVAGPQVMQGYHNKPAETAHALRQHDGQVWMHTGDVGRMDEDGFVYVVDRAKDMIIVGGFKVFSSEVEDKLYQHPAIEFCALIGVPNPERPETEIVKLVVQKKAAYKDKPNEEVKAELLAFAREKLSPYKVPKIVEFVEAIPLTAVGKVDKKALRPKPAG